MEVTHHNSSELGSDDRSNTEILHHTLPYITRLKRSSQLSQPCGSGSISRRLSHKARPFPAQLRKYSYW
jgi:hypothetical protein